MADNLKLANALLNLAPELIKQSIQNANFNAEPGYLGGGTSGNIPFDNDSSLNFGLYGSKSKYNSGLDRANIEYNKGNNAFGVEYNKYYNPMPVMTGAEGQNVMPEGLQNKLQYFGGNTMPGDLLNFYYKKQF